MERKSKKTLDKVHKPNDMSIFWKIEPEFSPKKKYARHIIAVNPIIIDYHTLYPQMCESAYKGFLEKQIQEPHSTEENENNTYTRDFSDYSLPKLPGKISRKFLIECCSICGSFLTKKYPKDYPEDWKFCCNCYRIANLIADGIITPQIDRTSRKIQKIIDKITIKSD